MSKTYFLFVSSLEVVKRDDDPWDPVDPRCRGTEALNPSSFHCCLSQEPFTFSCSTLLCVRVRVAQAVAS
jgi:hypothetical protein